MDPSNDRDVVGNFFDVGIRFNNRLRGCTVSVCCWRQFVNDLGLSDFGGLDDVCNDTQYANVARDHCRGFGIIFAVSPAVSFELRISDRRLGQADVVNSKDGHSGCRFWASRIRDHHRERPSGGREVHVFVRLTERLHLSNDVRGHKTSPLKGLRQTVATVDQLFDLFTCQFATTLKFTQYALAVGAGFVDHLAALLLGHRQF